MAASFEMLRTRWWPLMVLNVLTPIILATDFDVPLEKTTFALAAVLLAFSALMIINDCFDVEVDRLQVPQRPLPSGRVTLWQAWLLSGLLAILASLLAVQVGWLLLAGGFIVALLCILDFTIMKRFALKILVPVSTGFTTFVVYIAFAPLSQSAVLLFLLRAFWDFGEDTCGDLRDRDSDLRLGKRTIATVLGPQLAAKVVAIASCATVMTVVFIGLDVGLHYAFFIIAGIASIPYVVSSFRLSANWVDVNRVHLAHRTTGIYLPVVLGVLIITFALGHPRL